ITSGDIILMAYSFSVPAALAQQGWKVKIRDRERNEPPHVTILFRTRAWRYGLRERLFLDREPPPREVPVKVIAAIEAQLGQIKAVWDQMYPENPVDAQEGQ
ncbi:MAG TPA: hypothetical protein VFQ76_18515, partial [Longimicrobiaceae bacterium]|nr:hypothetical protein [Longimicrobiaceae bacterium]